MTGLRLAILLAAGIALAPFSAHASDPIQSLVKTQQLKNQTPVEPNILIVKEPIIKVPPKNPSRPQKTGGPGQTPDATPGATVAEKKKGGKKGTKGQQQEFMTIKMEEVFVTGRTAPASNPPKGPPGAGLLGSNSGGFNQGGPSAAGATSAPPPVQIK